MIYHLTTAAIIAAAIACGLFAALYARVTWWRSATGRNVMAMALCLVLLAGGALVRRLVHDPSGQLVLLIGWSLVAAVMVWRTVQMWRATHPRHAPVQPPPSPTPDGRAWYQPTPSSIIEDHRKGK